MLRGRSSRSLRRGRGRCAHYNVATCQRSLSGDMDAVERLNGQYDYRRGFSTTVSGEKGMIEVLGEGGARLDWAGQPVHLVLHRAGMPSETFRFDEGGDDVWDSEIAYYSRGHEGRFII